MALLLGMVLHGGTYGYNVVSKLLTPKSLKDLHDIGQSIIDHEATFAEDNKARAKETFHSTAVQAATLAQKAQVKKLILGHFSARYQDDSIFLQEAQEIFPHTIIAKESMQIRF